MCVYAGWVKSMHTLGVPWANNITLQIFYGFGLQPCLVKNCLVQSTIQTLSQKRRDIFSLDKTSNLHTTIKLSKMALQPGLVNVIALHQF